MGIAFTDMAERVHAIDALLQAQFPEEFFDTVSSDDGPFV